MQGQPFVFDQHSVQLNSFYGASGAISFAGRWQSNGKRYGLTMSPEGNLAQVTALTESVDAALNLQKLNMSAVSAGKQAASPSPTLLQEVHLTCVQKMVSPGLYSSRDTATGIGAAAARWRSTMADHIIVSVNFRIPYLADVTLHQQARLLHWLMCCRYVRFR